MLEILFKIRQRIVVVNLLISMQFLFAGENVKVFRCPGKSAHLQLEIRPSDDKQRIHRD